MIFSLEISNFILIDHVVMDINEGLTGIVGESGSGKSLIFKAIAWLINVKKDKEVVGKFGKDCFVSFIDKKNRMTYTKRIENDKRIYTINDQTVGMRQFIESIQQLISFIAQGSALTLFKGNQLIEVLDSHNGDNQQLMQEYHLLYEQYNQLMIQVKQSKASILDESMKVYYQEIINTINTLPFQDDKQEDNYKQLDATYQNNMKRKSLVHQFNQYKGELDALLSQWKTYYPLYNEDQLAQLIHDISALKHHMETIIPSNEEVSIDIECINKALYISASLKRKFKVTTIAQLLAIAKDAQEKLDYTDGAIADYDNALQKLDQLKPKLERYAFQLHANRLFTLSKIESKLYPILKQLGLNNLSLIITSQSKDYFDYGNQTISLSVNYNHLTYDIDLLSGGEKSRFLLGFYTALDIGDNTLLCFDEIDSGISGENAKAMAYYLRLLAKRIPIVLISHNPLVIAASNHTYLVSKESNDVSTMTTIKSLVKNDKINAIAKLSSGQVDDHSLHLATSLLMDYE